MATDTTIAGKYRVGKRIGGGSFGEIFTGKIPTAAVLRTVFVRRDMPTIWKGSWDKGGEWSDQTSTVDV